MKRIIRWIWRAVVYAIVGILLWVVLVVYSSHRLIQQQGYTDVVRLIQQQGYTDVVPPTPTPAL